MLFVLDASAMIAFLRDESGASRGQEVALNAISDLARIGIAESAEISTEFWQAAGAIKAIHRRVSLADCFAIALAKRLGATILTADHHEFDALAGRGVCAVEFIR